MQLAKREQQRLEEEKEIERITKNSVCYEDMPIEDLSMLSLYRDLKLSTPLKVKVQRYNEDLIQSFASHSTISKGRAQYYHNIHSRSFTVDEPAWPESDSSSSSSSSSDAEMLKVAKACGKRFNYSLH